MEADLDCGLSLVDPASSLLPRALFVAVCLQALAALVLRHFQTTFLLQITHGVLCVM